MDNVPEAKRPNDMEHVFAGRSSDPLIEPDRVSPSIEGYFRIPPVWIGDTPNPDTVKVLNPAVHHQIVVARTLQCGIEVRVQRDGTFLFDFCKWPIAPQIVIPGFIRPGQGVRYYIPRATSNAEEKAEGYAVIRAQVMNVHQACLSSSELHVRRRSAGMGNPVAPSSVLKMIRFEDAGFYHDDNVDVSVLARNVINNKDNINRKTINFRRTLELDVVEHSLILLDKILSSNDTSALQLVEAAYIAAFRYSEHRYGESITLSWGACEQLVSLLWRKMLDDISRDVSKGERITKIRRDKLLGRDYTASVMVEMLEANDRINHGLYRMLEVARKARNAWAHELRQPKPSTCDVCLRALRQLMLLVKGISIEMPMTRVGGVPQWPVWMWNKAGYRRP